MADSNVADAIAHSDEYFANFVIKPDYLKLLGRSADEAGLHSWTAAMRAGLSDQQVQARFAASDEFYKRSGGNDADWLSAVYKELFNRPVDDSGAKYWSGKLAQGQTRLQVADGIAGSGENNMQLINDDYSHYLGHAPDAAGLENWLKQFAEGKTSEDVIASFLGSAEYYKEHTA